jgi:hypothetical protein
MPFFNSVFFKALLALYFCLFLALAVVGAVGAVSTIIASSKNSPRGGEDRGAQGEEGEGEEEEEEAVVVVVVLVVVVVVVVGMRTQETPAMANFTNASTSSYILFTEIVGLPRTTFERLFSFPLASALAEEEEGRSMAKKDATNTYASRPIAAVSASAAVFAEFCR